ncbi:zinc finger BED domain-containing protein DAYSLEEPER-like [Apium graveolens]|uniref:zinc finger BED domain-containing protein DAYSLEEPER-like n=1 Tax=Apium graveolens TaxID=4045 RepID=UPI003D7ABA02
MEGSEGANEDNNQLDNAEMQLDDVEMLAFSLELQEEILEMQSPNLDMQVANYEMQPQNWEMQEADVETEVSHPNQTPERIDRKKKTSFVWDYFTIENFGGGCTRACCIKCKQSFAYRTGTKVSGTSHLKRHITLGSGIGCNREWIQIRRPNAPANRPYRQPILLRLDLDRCRHDIAKIIIMNEYPLHMVEDPGLIAFVKNLQPRFDMVSFDTVQGDCVATYLREKQSLQKVLAGIPGRISLTLDLWGSSQTVGYVFVTGQFTDSEWKMHRKLLNVVMEPFPESDSAFSHSVAACLSDWNMNGRLVSLTINQSLTNDAKNNLKAMLSVKNPNLLGGQLVLENCLARALSIIAQEALRAAQYAVKIVRDSVKYVKTSESRELQFIEIKQKLQVTSTKSLTLDDQTQWNTTYEMLLTALELKEVFCCLDIFDPDYRETPSMEDWKMIEILTTYLNLLFDTARPLTTSVILTTDKFFLRMCSIWLELAHASTTVDSFVSNITIPMKTLFDKYWNSCYLILAAAVVMNPLYKMKLVEFNFGKIYGDQAAFYIKYVKEGVHELFNEYTEHSLNFTNVSLNLDEGGPAMSSNGPGLSDFDMYIKEARNQQSKSELDQYLEESVLPRVPKFDVLGWWKLNKNKYPTLSKMARDMLSVPVCSVGPDLVFHTESKMMDPYRCSLRPETVEALVCAKAWLQSDSSGQAVPVTMEFPI